MWRATLIVIIIRCVCIFQSSPSCGGRRNIICNSKPLIIISILALVWRATLSKWLLCLLCKFQSSPSCGGRPIRSSHSAISSDFNPRPRVEGDPTGIKKNTNRIISILALVWRATAFLIKITPHVIISILALVWRATSRSGNYTGTDRISILALVWRATVSISPALPCSTTFQSSPSCGGRRSSHFGNYGGSRISILALVWRATI